ncbi:hypothetical protein [Leifsonia sp. AG29]|uniref:hypothetical protein n=1 Tax=Leifsonia sp. AG29 TaxID=2598860 RepID=UPI0018EF2928|nr:hypothetical protein [Leifsonia sp. AG29]
MTTWMRGKRVVGWTTGLVGVVSVAGAGLASGVLFASTPTKHAAAPASVAPTAPATVNPSPAPTSAAPSPSESPSSAAPAPAPAVPAPAPAAPAPAPAPAPVQPSQGGSVSGQSSGS